MKPSKRDIISAAIAACVAVLAPGVFAQAPVIETLPADVTTLFSFSGTDGAVPQGGLLNDGHGNFYGITNAGGVSNLGTVFRITSSGSFTTLYSFSGADGSGPYEGLAQGVDGNFYGTTVTGGTNNKGTVYRITPGGAFTSLYSFSGPEGALPYGGLVSGTDGNFYGTAFAGGNSRTDGTNVREYGSVFRITPSGSLTPIHLFSEESDDGYNPQTSLAGGTDGAFYGVAQTGKFPAGTIFKITTSGSVATVCARPGAIFSVFYYATPPHVPAGLFAQGSDGDIYETDPRLVYPPSGYPPSFGTIYRISSSGSAAALHLFTGGDDGGYSTSPLMQGNDGYFYGTTSTGGSGGAGTIFVAAPGGVFQTLVPFLGPNGSAPQAALLQDAAGYFYGSTQSGGANNCGTIFRMSPPQPVTTTSISGTTGLPFSYQIRASGSPVSFAATGLPDGLSIDTATGLISGTPTGTSVITGNVTIRAINASGTGSATLALTFLPLPPVVTQLLTRYSFSGTDGANPSTRLCLAGDGNFYGTTAVGGSSNNGTFFKLTPGGVFTLLRSAELEDGGFPGGLAQGNDGDFYGVAGQAGALDGGTIFRITASGSFTKLHDFDPTVPEGANPSGVLALGDDGNFYGTTTGGGNNNNSTVYRITPSGSFTSLASLDYSDLYNTQTNTGVTKGGDGDFYGVTFAGEVFKITPGGVFSRFQDFSMPVQLVEAGLVLGSDGSLYGTATGYDGAVYRFTPGGGGLTTLFQFDGTNGEAPYGGLVQGSDGNFYGTTVYGGSGGSGTLYRITPGGSWSPLYSFSGADGAFPNAELVQGANGNFYGTTIGGGASDQGTVFEFAPGFVATGTSGEFHYGILAQNNPTGYAADGLPAGLAVNTVTGLISGTPTVTGTFNVTLTAGNAGGTGTGSLTIVVDGLPAFTGPLVAGASTGADFSYQIAATGDPGSYSATGLPPGLSLDTGTGVISGTATELGTYNVTITATNVNGTASATLVITVHIPPPEITDYLTRFNFDGSGGWFPAAPLLLADDGNFYGTTSTGDGSTGAIFKFAPNGTFTLIKSLADAEGSNPGGLVRGDDGAFYGVAGGGGASGCGTIFRVTPSGSFTKLYDFGDVSTPEGSGPVGTLVRGNDGNFYGATYAGGINGSGTVFRITPGGSFTLLGPLDYPTLGAQPVNGLVRGDDGNFYGAASEGGSNYCGTVFKVTPGGVISLLHNFEETDDGATPTGGLLQASDGYLYGTTVTSNGAVFRVSTGGDFTALGGSGAGLNAGLIQAKDGNLYGTARAGGANLEGTIFRVTPDGTVTTLHDFSLGTGIFPQAGLVQGNNGNFYGTTNTDGGAGYGTIFEFAPLKTSTRMSTGFHYQILAINDPESFSADGLPAGLVVDTATGLISGTATVTGTFSVTMGAINDGGAGTGTLTLVVQPAPAPVITSGTSATTTQGTAFSYQIAADYAPTGYAATGLPAGLGVNTGTGLISGTATVSGTFSPVISAINASGTGGATLALVVQSPYSVWQGTWFTADDLLDPAICGDTATPAHDGMPNLLKYALGLDPKIVGTASLPDVDTITLGGSSYLTLDYTRPLTATDISYIVEVSGDLKTWNSGSGYTTVISGSTNPGGTTQTIVTQDNTPSDNTRRFIRLKVTRP